MLWQQRLLANYQVIKKIKALDQKLEKFLEEEWAIQEQNHFKQHKYLKKQAQAEQQHLEEEWKTLADQKHLEELQALLEQKCLEDEQQALSEQRQLGRSFWRGGAVITSWTDAFGGAASTR